MDMTTLRLHTAHLIEVWEYYVSPETLPPNRQWGRWLEWNPPERIEEAIKGLAKRLQKPQPMSGGTEGLHRYITASLKGMKNACPAPPPKDDPDFVELDDRTERENAAASRRDVRSMRGGASWLTPGTPEWKEHRRETEAYQLQLKALRELEERERKAPEESHDK